MMPPAHFNCKCYIMPMQQVTPAESLLEVARAIKSPKDRFIYSEALTTSAFARIKLALDLDARAEDFKLRAIFEEWDNLRLIQEMY